MKSRRRVAYCFLLSSALVLSGCATDPASLATPKEISCIHLKEPIVSTGRYGIGVQWTTRLERGPYWSEKLDEKGTYFRGPPGAVAVYGENGSPFPGQGATSDGGFYVPMNATEPITTYRYFTVEAAPTQVPAADADCSSVSLTRDPVTHKLDVATMAAAGGVGGAIGGLAGRSVNSNSGMSYGQAAGVGLAGGLIAGALIAAMINADIGKIVGGLEIKDPEVMDRLRAAALMKVPVRDAQIRIAESAPPAPATPTAP